MIGLRIVPLAGAAAQPWRNGGGVTRELLTWPASAHPWALRISVAQIDRPGPFSAFADVERWFAVVEGAGVELHEGEHRHRLTPHSEPLCFDGAAAPDCQLLGGPTLDLNLMARRGTGSAGMHRARREVAWRSNDEWRALYTNGPARLQVEGRHAAHLAAPALVWHACADGSSWSFHPSEEATLGWWMTFQANGAKA